VSEKTIGEPPYDHNPCCSSHNVRMLCENYRRTHFVEVRPCCSLDAIRLRADRLHGKNRVERTDGQRKPHARYFVLDYANDPAAKEALRVYAAAVRATNPELAADLESQVGPAEDRERVIAALREEAEEYAEVLGKQADLLTSTVNVLRGDPPPLVSWSHHDVPDLAQEVVDYARGQGWPGPDNSPRLP